MIHFLIVFYSKDKKKVFLLIFCAKMVVFDTKMAVLARFYSFNSIILLVEILS